MTCSAWRTVRCWGPREAELWAVRDARGHVRGAMIRDCRAHSFHSNKTQLFRIRWINVFHDSQCSRKWRSLRRRVLVPVVNVSSRISSSSRVTGHGLRINSAAKASAVSASHPTSATSAAARQRQERILFGHLQVAFTFAQVDPNVRIHPHQNGEQQSGAHCAAQHKCQAEPAINQTIL